MAISFPQSCVFPCNGHYYDFYAALYDAGVDDKKLCIKDSTEEIKDIVDFELDSKFIEMFEYETQLNGLIATGKLVYEDETGRVANILAKQSESIIFVFDQFSFNKSDGDAKVKLIDPSNISASKSLDQGQMIQQAFNIDQIKVLSRSTQSVRYEFQLVSTNWANLYAKVEYSNYNDNPKDIFSILRECFRSVQQDCDEKSFNDVKTDVTLQYSTRTNDTCSTVTRYLMNKLYFYAGNLDKSMKFIYYDVNAHAMKLIDLKNQKSHGESRTCVLDLGNKTSFENMQGKDIIRLGSVNRVSKRDLFEAMENVVRYSHNYTKNSLVSNSISQKNTISYMNSRPDDDTMHVDKYFQKQATTIPDSLDFQAAMTSLNFNHEDSEWNSKKQLYDEITNAVMGDNGLVVNASGRISFIPGCLMEVGIPVENKDVANQSQVEYEKRTNMFNQFNGTYFVSKVHNFISPKDKTFTQNIVLFKTSYNK